MDPRLQVFKEEPGFIKLFQLFKEKYRSLDRIGGKVSLKSFKPDEVASIAGFLGQPCEKLAEKGSLALLDFEKELAKTGFSDYHLLLLLEEVLGETIFTKKEEEDRKSALENDFIQRLKQAIPEGDWWLEWICSKKPDTRWFWSHYQQNKEEWFEKVVLVFQAFSLLPKEGEFERLPFFSQRTTGNPHYFDSNEAAEKLLLHCMYVDQVRSGNTDAVMPKTVGEKNDLLSEYGIMRDDLWNFITCQGLLAASGNQLHSVWKAAAETRTVLNVPMKELVKIERVWPATGKKVWVVENSSVSSTMMDALPDAPIICTHGQIRLAGWLLLDKLVQSDCTLYYSGDIDPEGIVIADKLKKRYKERLVIWGMDTEAYKTSLSEEDITNRLPKLDRIASPAWNELISLMREIKLAGYQEAIVPKLIKDIRANSPVGS